MLSDTSGAIQFLLNCQSTKNLWVGKKHDRDKKMYLIKEMRFCWVIANKLLLELRLHLFYSRQRWLGSLRGVGRAVIRITLAFFISSQSHFSPLELQYFFRTWICPNLSTFGSPGFIQIYRIAATWLKKCRRPHFWRYLKLFLVVILEKHTEYWKKHIKKSGSTQNSNLFVEWT